VSYKLSTSIGQQATIKVDFYICVNSEIYTYIQGDSQL
jgi:hypothetical protein